MTQVQRGKRGVTIGIILALISMIGASIVQTSGGRVEVKDLRWETPSGRLMSALLFIPPGADEDNPVPGIVTSHGWYNNREMQDLNYVEYSRRGYVVMSIDMYGHGHSDAVAPSEWSARGTGMYDAVELMADLPYVDRSRIGVTGHSNGARAANWSVKEDNLRDEPLIASVLLVANDGMYTDDPNEPLYTPFVPYDQKGTFVNNYGDRDVGIIAAQFDEFFFRSRLPDGTVTKPREFITTENAQSFLRFGTDPAQYDAPREASTLYTQTVNGTEAIRAVYTPYQIHPWNHVSTRVVSQSVEFFEASLGAPRSLPPGNQIWPLKLIFNAVGLVAFVMFAVGLAKVFCSCAFFAPVVAGGTGDGLNGRPAGAGAMASFRGPARTWFWISSVLIAIIAAVTYLRLYGWTSANRPAFFPQAPTYYIGVWSAVMGLVVLAALFVGQRWIPGAQVDLRERGVRVGWTTLWRTIIVAIVVVAAAFGLVFLADYFFKTDFRAWVLTIRTFTPDKIGIALRYAPLFLLYYVPQSLAVNGFNYVSMGRKEWVNTAVVAGFTALGPAVVVLIQYVTFFVTGEVFFTGVSNIVGIWLFPIVVILPVAAIISRKIYHATGNPYLGGIVNGLIVPLIMSSNTLTQL